MAPSPPPPHPDHLRDVEAAERLARWTDRRFLDPIIGFILPGAGDLVGAVVGLNVVRLALKHDLPKSTVARMLLNLSVDSLGGAIPVVGDLFDIVHRANVKNVALLRERAAAKTSGARDAAVMAGAALLFCAALALPIWLLVKAIGALTS